MLRCLFLEMFGFKLDSFFYAESCKKPPAWTELGCFADCGGGESRLSLLFCFIGLLKTSIMEAKNVAVCKICR